MNSCALDVWYLSNSSFALTYNNIGIIFDYYNDKPLPDQEGLAAGAITEDFFRDKNEVYVFASHQHYDHYHKIIYDWTNIFPNIFYVLSDDIPEMAMPFPVYRVAPNQHYQIGTLSIDTYLSNDEGVAFYLELDNIGIYHSGDLNWWHWEEEDGEWNKNIRDIYLAQMSSILKKPIQIAFIPVDPRLEKHYALALSHSLKHLNKRCNIFPMHFGSHWEVFEWLERDGFMNDNRIQTIHQRGEHFSILCDS